MLLDFFFRSRFFKINQSGSIMMMMMMMIIITVTLELYRH